MVYRILFLLLLAGSLWAADAPRNLGNTESPVSARCVSPDGLTYESCGGSGGGGSGGLTNTELRATPVPVSGTVTASGPLTDAQLRATAVPVSGTVTASGPLTDIQLRATAVPISGALTDAELRATAVPVSGTVTASGPVTDAELRATPVPVSGTVTVTDGAGAVNVIVDSSALPTGAATAANQDGIVKDGAGDTTQANVSGGRLHVDGSGVTQPVSGTVTIGTFPDNEPINVSQINGVTPLMGAGNTGTGSPRVTIASDQAPVTVRAANSNAIISATANAALNMTTATTTEIVPLSGSTVPVITSFSIITGGATNVKFVRGTGTNCATGQADISSNMHFTTSVVGLTRGSGQGGIIFGAAGGAICVTSSAAVNVDVDVSYAQF